MKFRHLLLALLGLITLDIFLLFSIGGEIGGWLTFGLTVLTAVVGMNFLKGQRIQVLGRIQERFQEQQVPIDEMAESILLFIVGAFLIIPGFITDFLGFTGLIPQGRRWLIAILMAFKTDLTNDDTIIEGEVEPDEVSVERRVEHDKDIIEGEIIEDKSKHAPESGRLEN